MENNIKMFDLTFVGSGPSTIFALLKLVEDKYQGNICVVEKGNSLFLRKPNEIISGFAGAGCFSDSKLTSSLDVGGIIADLREEDLESFNKYILEKLNYFKSNIEDKTPLHWSKPGNFDTKNSGLEWNEHKTCHVGTDNGQAIYKEIEKYLRTFPNINFLFNTNVEDVEYKDDYYRILLDHESYICSKKLILATGQKDGITDKIIKKYNIKTTPRATQIGIRVEDTMNEQYENIIKENYDFKFVKNYTCGNINVRIRTFCCNSGNAHVCCEKTNDGFSCFNGHAFKQPDPNNHSVNYGIICEITGDESLATRDAQVKLMRAINSDDNWKQDNFDINGNVVPQQPLLGNFETLGKYYPTYVIECIKDFVKSLSQLVNLDKAHYLYPEIKLNNNTPLLNKNLET